MTSKNDDQKTVETVKLGSDNLNNQQNESFELATEIVKVDKAIPIMVDSESQRDQNSNFNKISHFYIEMDQSDQVESKSTNIENQISQIDLTVKNDGPSNFNIPNFGQSQKDV